MGLLPWSFGFLLIFSLLLWTQLKTMTDALFEHQLVIESMELSGNDIGNRVTEQMEEPATRLKGTGGKKNCTSKLHLKGLFSTESSATKDAEKKILLRLVSALYGSQPIFHEGDNRERVVELFERVCDKVEEILEKETFSKIDDLAAKIDLRENPEEMNIDHRAYYHMLLGGVGALRGRETCRLDGLQYYISLDKFQKGILNMYLAPKKLLLALFGEGREDVVNELLEYRQELWRQIHANKGSNLEAIANDFKQKYESSLPSDIDAAYIDFGVSTTRPVDSPYDRLRTKKLVRRR
jgi:hypothetical protein